MRKFFLKLWVLCLAVCTTLCVFVACGGTHEHKFTNYVSDNNATYDKDGTKTATCDVDGCKETDTITDEGTKLQSYIEFKTLDLEQKNIFANEKEEFSFANEIEIFGNSTFSVASDKYGANVFLIKVVPLAVGDNTFYVFESLGGEIVNTYTVVLRRRPMYSVTFNGKGGSETIGQTVEESFTATMPETNPTRAGYTFDGWDFDFSSPITSDTEIDAKWTANTNTPYKVEYYQENLNDSNYTLVQTVNKVGTTDTVASAEIKAFAHFTATGNTVSGNINGDGSTVLKVYYTRNRYTVSLSAIDNKGNVTGSGTYANAELVTAKATVNAGYTFDGWYNGQEKVSSDLIYNFNPIANTTLTAKWTANTNTPYKVEYYQENVNDSNYTLVQTINKVGTTDTIATAEVGVFEYFVTPETAVKGNINGDGSTVLKVYYTRNKYTVTFDGNGGRLVSGKASQTVKYGGTVTVPTFTRTGYTLAGFDKTNYTNISESFTATAQWQINQYTITLVLGNGEEDIEITKDYGTAIDSIEDPKYDDYHGFYGWDKTIPTTMPAKDITITAIWKEIFVVSNNEITGLTDYGKTLKEITIPDDITSIGSWAFDYCQSLASITIPNSVTSIDDSAFNGCISLTSIVIPNSVTSIGTQAFYYCSSLTSITIPNSVTYIDLLTFSNCSSLTSVVIPNSVTSIGWEAFANCESLTSIEIPNSVTSIDCYAFSGCSSLTSVTIPNSVTSIGEGAFSSCYSLKWVAIPDSVTSIGSSAFYNCSSLTIYCEAQSQPDGWYSYWNSSNCPVVWGYKGEE